MQSTKTPRDPAQPYLIRATLTLIAVYALILIGGPDTSDLTNRLLGYVIDACVLVAICDLPARYQAAAYACHRIARCLVRTTHRMGLDHVGMFDHAESATATAH